MSDGRGANPRGTSRVTVVAALSVIAVLGACAPAWKEGPYDQLFQYEPPRAYIKAPPEREPSDWYDHGYQLGVRPLGRLVSPARYVAVVAGGRDAQDVNRFGQVPDSAWFENRIGRRDYTEDEVFHGNARNAGLASGPLLVISGKIDGVSAGFVIRDSAKQVWYLKLDHPAFPELSTSAEVISQRLLWLAGYRVPVMLTVDVEPSRFVLDASARTKDRYGRSIPLTVERLANLVRNSNPDARGRVRVLISKQPPGVVLGPWEYSGRRLDDPNDVIDHEHRRSLRGLWLFSAWLNNTDTRAANTLDMFRPITPDGRGIIEHYLIDFGDAFGSAGLGEKAQVEGWEYMVDWSAITANLLSFGLGEPPYRDIDRSPFRAVGLFEGKTFIADEWKPELPNPAFDARTPEDDFWAASILARIQPEHIRAAVGAGHYSESGAAGYVVEVLLSRRRKLLEKAFVNQVELDRPRIVGPDLVLDDLRALGGLGDVGIVKYVVRWDRTAAGDQDLLTGELESANKRIAIPTKLLLDAARREAVSATGDPYITIELTRFGGDTLEVHCRVTMDRILPIGVTRN